MTADTPGNTGTRAPEMERSWLVQRLERPYERRRLLGLDNPFAFGGGLVNGGLSKDAMDLLRGVFRFDYMGAAEFEWGAVPKALNTIAKAAKQYCAFSVRIPLAEVARHWRDKSKGTPVGNAEVYVICRREQAAPVETQIREWAAGRERLKESTRLAAALRPVAEWDTETCGWLELDNGFFFFTDKVMFEATTRLFGVTPSDSRQAGEL